MLAALGRYEECIATLEPCSLRATTIEYLYYWPVFDPIRKAPRFLKVIADVGAKDAHERAQAWRASQAALKDSKK